MSLTPTQLSELQTIVETLRTEFPSSDDDLWEAAIRIQKAGLGPVTGPGGQAAFDSTVADIVTCSEEISTVQGRQGGLGNSFKQATFQVVPVEDNLPSGTVGGVIYLETVPNTYAFTDVIELDPAGPNSVILSEVGTQVARTVPAASGGLEVNNLATGGGFERVATVSDVSLMLPPGTNLGDMIRWDGVSAYEIAFGVRAEASAGPPGPGTGYVEFNTTATTDVRRPQIWAPALSTTSVLYFVETDNSPQDGFYLRTAGAPTNATHSFGRETAGVATDMLRMNQDGEIDIEADFFMLERAAANPDRAGFGQLFVRNDTPNVLIFRDDAGTEFDLTAAGGAPGGADTNVQFNNAGAFGGNAAFTFTPATEQVAISNTAAANPALVVTMDQVENIMVLNINGVNTGGIRFETTQNSAYTIFDVNDSTGGNGFRLNFDPTLSAANHELELISDQFGTIFEAENEGNFYLGGAEGTAILQLLQTGTQRILVNTASLNFAEKAAASAAVNTEGQVWVRNDTPNTLMFSDDAGTDFVVAGAGASFVNSFEGRTGAVVATAGDYADVLETFSVLQTFTGAPAVVISNASAALGIRETGGTADEGNWIWRANADILRLQTATDAAPNNGVDQPLRFFRTGTSMDEIIIGDTPLVTINQEANAVTDLALGESTTLRGNSQQGRILLYGEEASSITLVTVGNSGTQMQISLPAAVGFQMSGDGAYNAQFRDGATISIFDTDDSDSMSLSHNGTHGVQTSTGNGIRFNVPLYIAEQAAANADTATLGQVWVRNDAPNNLMFTDDAGTDFVIGGSGAPTGVSNPLTADLDGDGFNLDDMGVMFMREQASADADVSTQGQLWVRTETFSNTLMFTNDNGNDFVVAGLAAQGDMSAGSVLIAGTSFVAVANVGPRTSTDYSFIAHVEVTAPAADDMNIQFTADTNTQLKAVLTASDGTISEIESTTGEVITNNVLVTTDGSASPNGTYVKVQGIIRTGATTQTLSLRCAKNADTGADGFAVLGTIQLFPVNPV